jgi:hypothetical protein
MRSFIRLGLIGCVLFVAVESFGQGAGMCREPECGRTENDRTNQDRSRQQDNNRPPDTSGDKDRSPCGPNPPDKGFVYKDQRGNGTVHADPSADSEVIGTPPNGSRLMYDRVSESGGRRWYHVNNPGGRSGWLPASDVSCERPTAPPPYRGPIRDCDIPTADTSSAQGGARGFAPGSACDQYQQQQGPVSLLEAPVQFLR